MRLFVWEVRVGTGALARPSRAELGSLPDSRTTVDSRFVLRDSAALSSKTKRAS